MSRQMIAPFRRTAGFLTAATLGLAAASPARAQGSVSVQGFGYPPGQLGTRAGSMGGGIAEHDAESPLNPAAMLSSRTSLLFFQYAPEFRAVTADGRTERTTTLRFPLIGGTARLGERARIGLTVSTLLDRTFAINLTDTSTSEGAPTISTDRFRNEGGMSDVRFAGAWRFGSRVDVGAGVHAVTGQNRARVNRALGDSLELSLEDRTISFSGSALSAGGMVQLSSTVSLAASLLRGGELRARTGDTLLARGRVPDRMGAGVRYTGITGTTLAARAEYVTWSNMREMGSATLSAFDTWEVGGGADVQGPRLGSRSMLLRAGARWRELPFGVGATKVTEFELGGGVGVQLPFERAFMDAGVRRASRSAGDARETGWTVSLGVSVRP